MQNGHAPASNRRNVRVLVTAFGAFPGAPANPTEAIVRQLQREAPRFARGGIDLRVATMPVRFADVALRLAALLREHQPDIVIHLGLAARRRQLSIESRARNRLTVLHPDAAGASGLSLTVTPGGPPIRLARWNPEALAATMRRAGLTAAPSQDAGDYLCNQTLYETLGLFDGPAGFIHVPRLRRRRPAERRASSRVAKAPALPTLADATRGVASAIRLAARDLRRAPIL